MGAPGRVRRGVLIQASRGVAWRLPAWSQAAGYRWRCVTLRSLHTFILRLFAAPCQMGAETAWPVGWTNMISPQIQRILRPAGRASRPSTSQFFGIIRPVSAEVAPGG